jgi:L-Ala-D/L-Glu epimerase
MRITAFDIRTVSIPFKRPYQSSQAAAGNCNHVIIRMHTDDGITGYGEGAPGVNERESPMERVALAIRDCLAPAVLGLDPTNVARLHVAMDEAIAANGFAKAAIDMAAYDILGKSLNVPVHALLGGKYRDAVPVNAAVAWTPDDESLRAEVKRIAGQGYKVIKVKGSRNPEADVKRLRAIRAACGDAPCIRVDFNAAYADNKSALAACRAMEPYGIDLFEQPLFPSDTSGMAHLCHALDTAVMADESVFTIRDAARIVREQAADILNVKIQKAGGIYRAMQIVHFAHCANVPVVVGAHSETGVGQAASLHVAAACPDLRYACDVRTAANLTEDITTGLRPVERGEIACPDGPGLGVALDIGILDRYTTYQMSVQ